MRTTIQTQMPIVNPYIDHDHAQELQAISEILDSEPAIVKLVYDDLIRGGIETDNGREGMTAEQVLRGPERKPALAELIAEGARIVAGGEALDPQTRLYPLGTTRALARVLRQKP